MQMVIFFSLFVLIIIIVIIPLLYFVYTCIIFGHKYISEISNYCQHLVEKALLISAHPICISGHLLVK